MLCTKTVLSLALWAQIGSGGLTAPTPPASSLPALPGAAVPGIAVSGAPTTGSVLSGVDFAPTPVAVAEVPAGIMTGPGGLMMASPPGAVTGLTPLSAARSAFQSDREFDGFTGPLSNPVQFKDPRSLTEARLLFMNNWSRPSTPVVGGGSIQVYALQLRLALTERLQLYADKDGIVRLSPEPGRSVTGLANIMAGLKYVWIRDVENQFLFSTAVQYEAPTGYANIFQNQGAGLLGVYGILGKEFGDNWHMILQFGQNTALDDVLTGYFLTSFHIDRRFGKFTPFYEANWFYYNQPGNFLPPSVGIEGGGWLSLGTAGVSGDNWVTNAVGFKYDVTQNLEFGLGYEFQVSSQTQLLNNQLHAQLILRY